MFATIKADMWQTTDLDELIAVELFGWQWWSFVGIPMRGEPDYPQKRRVRELMSPQQLAHERWQKFFAEKEGRRALGDESLSYAYCSSQGPEIVPHFSGHLDAACQMEAELERRGLMFKYEHKLTEVCGSIRESLRASAEQRCIAALLTIDSPSIKRQEATCPTDLQGSVSGILDNVTQLALQPLLTRL